MSQSRGDTLIEVMMAMAIIGSVIAISYATASRSLRVGRYAQERTEALKYAESQVEILKATAAKSTDVFTADQTTTFCLNTDGTLNSQNMVVDDVTQDTLLSSSAGAPGSGETYNASCAQGSGGRYKMSIMRVDEAGPPQKSTFIIRARWDRLGGGKDEVAIYYNLHNGLFR